MKLIIRAFTVADSLGFIEPVLPSLTKRYHLQILTSPDERLNQVSSQYKIKSHPVYMYRRMSPMKDLKSLWQIIRVFHREKPYMVHSMTPKAGLLCMLAAWMTRVPRRVHTFTGLVWPTSTGLKRKILMFTDWVTCACATHVIPEGQGVLNDLQQHITKKPMKVLGYGNIKGVDMERVSRRQEVMEKSAEIREDDKYTFIFVGRIVGDKGINELVSAFAKLNEKYPDTRLLIVGNYEENLDPLKVETLCRIKENIAIEAVGPKYGDELLAYYAASDCFVFPSYREGFPNTVLEAGAMELPSIVTDINGSREIIEDGFNGIVIPSKDDAALYDAMEKIMTNRADAERMALNARPLIAERFEQGFVRQCLLDFYEEIM